MRRNSRGFFRPLARRPKRPFEKAFLGLCNRRPYNQPHIFLNITQISRNKRYNKDSGILFSSDLSSVRAILLFVMGKIKAQPTRRRQAHLPDLQPSETPCKDVSAPICECCTVFGTEEALDKNGKDDLKELVVIGAGPHALSLMLRLLEPNADLMSEKQRHTRSVYAQRMNNYQQLRRHMADLPKGPSKVLSSASTTKKHCKDNTNPPPIGLNRLRQSVVVLDKSSPLSSAATSGWLCHWKQNFEAIQIPILRSPTYAHADPYDHRALEFYAERTGRADELVTLPYLQQRDSDFKGPYEAPSTSLFADFHDLLAKAYGIDDMVHSAVQVESIVPKPPAGGDGQGPHFEIHVRNIDNRIGESPETPMASSVAIKAKRVVCAMGPMFQTGEAFWETSLREGPNYPSQRLLHGHEIVPWLLQHNSNENAPPQQPMSLLIVGGGITSIHLTLLAAQESSSSWCQSVTLISRSKIKERQFDIDNKWMGPNRGKLMEAFAALDARSRARLLKEERQGGSVPPELIQKLRELDEQGCRSSGSKHSGFVKEEVQISHVKWCKDQFHVTFDNGSPEEHFDMIWLATGADNDLDLYPALAQLRRNHLPVELVGGMPVLDEELTWRRPNLEEEPAWKTLLRHRLYMMGSLAGLELGPDALNLIGARHGAVRVATSIRKDMNQF